MIRARRVLAIAAAFALASCADGTHGPLGPATDSETTQGFEVPGASWNIGFESHTTGFNDDASRFDLDRPGDVEEGDFLLAQLTMEKGSDLNITTVPTGWELVRRTDRSSDIGQAIYYKIATADEPATYRWVFGQSADAVGGILRYTGVDAEDPIVASSGNHGDGSELTALGVDAEDGSRLVAFFGMSEEADPFSTPAGMTRRYQVDNNDWDAMAADQDVGPGPTGNRVATSGEGDDKWVAQLVALRMTADADPAETSTTLAVDPEGTSEFGEEITLTAHVTSNGADVTEGAVEFRRGGDDCTDGTLIATEGVNGDGEATTSFSDLDVGEYVFRACYLGTDDFEASESDPVDHEVVKAATSTSLEVDPENESTFGDEITLTATVTRDHDGESVDEGSVTFQYGGESCGDADAVEIGTEEVDVDGKASTTVDDLASGDYVFRACYGGTASYESSDSDDVPHTVHPAFTIVVWAAHGNGSITDADSSAVNYRNNQGSWEMSFYVRKDGENVTDHCPADLADLADLDIAIAGFWTMVGDTVLDPASQATGTLTECANRGSEGGLRIVKFEIDNAEQQSGNPADREELEGHFEFTVEGVAAVNDVDFTAD